MHPAGFTFLTTVTKYGYVKIDISQIELLD